MFYFLDKIPFTVSGLLALQLLQAAAQAGDNVLGRLAPVTVPAGTKLGTYYIGYTICSTVASISVCDTATATVVVGNPTITADPDTFTITTGTSIKSVFDNDKIGTAIAITNTVSICLFRYKRICKRRGNCS